MINIETFCNRLKIYMSVMHPKTMIYAQRIIHHLENVEMHYYKKAKIKQVFNSFSFNWWRFEKANDVELYEGLKKIVCYL